MENTYIKVDDNKIINTTYIRWVKQMDECLYACTKSDGCDIYNTHRVCKLSNPDSYIKLQNLLKKPN